MVKEKRCVCYQQVYLGLQHLFFETIEYRKDRIEDRMRKERL